MAINSLRVPDRVSLIESLARGTANALLFGLTLSADLSTNDSGGRYGSSLRPDPRSIEGIVHATYVLARMNYALRRLLAAPHIAATEREVTEMKLIRNRTSYEAGLATVDAHARFTEKGAAIYADCRRAMRGEASNST